MEWSYMIDKRRYVSIMTVSVAGLLVCIVIPLYFENESIGSVVDWLVAYGTVGAVFISLWLSRPESSKEGIVVSNYRENCKILSKAAINYIIEKNTKYKGLLSFGFVNEEKEAVFISDIEIYLYYLAPNDRKIYTVNSLYENTYEDGYLLFVGEKEVFFPMKVPRKKTILFEFKASNFNRDFLEVSLLNKDDTKRYISTLYVLVKVFDEKGNYIEKVISEFYIKEIDLMK